MISPGIPPSSGAKVVKILAEYINLPQYLKTKWRGTLKGKHAYRSPWMNQFWGDVQNERIQPNDVVRLENAILTEWFPRAPGAHLGWQVENATTKHVQFREPERTMEGRKTGYWSERLLSTTSGRIGRRSKKVPTSLESVSSLGDKWHEETRMFNGSEEFLLLSPQRKTIVVLSGFGNLRFSIRPEGRLLSAVGSSYGMCPNAAEGILCSFGHKAMTSSPTASGLA
jgi:hypothetical protein